MSRWQPVEVAAIPRAAKVESEAVRFRRAAERTHFLGSARDYEPVARGVKLPRPRGVMAGDHLWRRAWKARRPALHVVVLVDHDFMIIEEIEPTYVMERTS